MSAERPESSTPPEWQVTLEVEGAVLASCIARQGQHLAVASQMLLELGVGTLDLKARSRIVVQLDPLEEVPGGRAG